MLHVLTYQPFQHHMEALLHITIWKIIYLQCPLPFTELFNAIQPALAT